MNVAYIDISETMCNKYNMYMQLLHLTFSHLVLFSNLEVIQESQPAKYYVMKFYIRSNYCKLLFLPQLKYLL